MTARRWLIVNADDFGLTAGVSRGIARAHRHGIVTSTSLMVDAPGAAAAARLAREHPGLDVGLHADARPDERDWSGALARQLERFRELMGRGPTHLDSHHDVHRD
ncbi:MAG TPA: ChbG/HpnK family deacetylase, partial [Solirubrobacteraceae bacterium]